MSLAAMPCACERQQGWLGGLLGRALDANQKGRLSNFITDETSPAIALYSPEQVCNSHEGDWYGEHAGKWLYAASKAAHRSGDEVLAQRVRRVAIYLAGVQDSDGYLGTYAPERRFMHKQATAPRSWNGAPLQRTWDIWNHACLTLGLLEVHKHWPDPKVLSAACGIGDLFLRTMTEGGINIAEIGLHHGMSATVLMDSAVDLHLASKDPKYLQLAQLILQQADQRPELALLQQLLAGTDAAEISTGKAYQLCWNLVGMAKLYKATGDQQYLQAVKNGWSSIKQYHLSLGGGPWGGVGLRSREIFNHNSVFSPQGYVETCSILSWIQLNRELLLITDEAHYAEEIERSAYNDLLGAMAPNGEDWCYYSFPNGKRVHTTYWRCCKSSGAMALEELPAIAYRLNAAQELTVNLYGPGKACFAMPGAGSVDLEQSTDYPFDGKISILVRPGKTARFAILLRIPSWTQGAQISVNGRIWAEPARPGSYARLEREWVAGDLIELNFPMPVVLHNKASCSVQESKDPAGATIRSEVMRYDYAAISRGPLVYATSLIDGFKMEETLRLPAADQEQALELLTTPPGFEGPAIRLNLDYREALTFQPYFEAGGRADGDWRLTWMQLAPAPKSAP